jgi:hypothetical protein
MATWSKPTFILFANHLGDCDADNERGLYIVDSMVFENDTLTTAAATTKSIFNKSTDEVEIVFTKPIPATSKRAVTHSFLGDFPGEFSLSDSPTATSLSIAAESSSFGGSLAVSGHLHYSWLKCKLTKLYVDVDLSLAAAANIKAAAGAA